MPSSGHGHPTYDENLLAAAPAATKQQLQSGYTTDLLNEKAGQVPPRKVEDVEAGRVQPDKAAKYTSNGTTTPLPTYVAPPAVPFYRTKKGIIIIGVAVVVILAAIIGGAVGGSKKGKKSPASLPAGQGGAAPPADTTQGGAAPLPTLPTLQGGSTQTTATTPGAATTTAPTLPTLPGITGGGGGGITLPTVPPVTQEAGGLPTRLREVDQLQAMGAAPTGAH
jgi:hypothetical protein